MTNSNVLVLDSTYKLLIKELKEKVTSARLHAVLSVNIEQIKLYWEIGNLIISKQKHTEWGTKFLEQLSSDLRLEFPEIKGFSKRNLELMRQFAQVYPSQIAKQSVSQLPWGHIVVLIQSVKENNARNWYVQKILDEGWSRNTLVRAIKTKLYARQGILESKTTNFEQCLPPAQSDLAKALIKEPYDFRFLPVAPGAQEREIELGLIEHVKDFLLELGTGFAFIGSQYHIEVAGEDYYIDLLFFNIMLNAYFVIELKIGKFKPEYAGKLNFYLSIVDDFLKQPHHNETIGLLLCENKNRVIAEYALNRTQSPMGISEYQLSKQIPDKLKKALPTTAVLEDKFSRP